MRSHRERNIEDAIRLACTLRELADRGEACARDDGCCVLFGVVRDCAYRIKGRAEQEREAHKRREGWGGGKLEGGGS
jgi:hypothetical protein